MYEELLDKKIQMGHVSLEVITETTITAPSL